VRETGKQKKSGHGGTGLDQAWGKINAPTPGAQNSMPFNVSKTPRTRSVTTPGSI